MPHANGFPRQGGAPVIGKSIGNYRFSEKIGEGGVGEVWLATDLLLNRPVAMKSLRADLATEPKILERFRSEAQTLAQLNHSNVATLYALLREDDTFWMVMEYVEGQTFAELLRRSGRMEVGHALPLFFQALDGFGYAHERGIIHRDIKGSNIMLSTQKVVKVMDFGIARALGSDRLTRHGHMVGTLQYMSPEQVRGKDSDARSDIYSLGILLFHLITGRVPFRRANDFELMQDQIARPAPSPHSIEPSIPEAIAQSVLRALAKAPEERFASTGEFRAALEAGAVGIELETITPPTDERERAAAEKGADAGRHAVEPTRVIAASLQPFEDFSTGTESLTRATPRRVRRADATSPLQKQLARVAEAATWRRGALAAAAFTLAIGLNLLFAERRPPVQTPSTTKAIAELGGAETTAAEALIAPPADFEASFRAGLPTSSGGLTEAAGTSSVGEVARVALEDDAAGSEISGAAAEPGKASGTKAASVEPTKRRTPARKTTAQAPAPKRSAPAEPTTTWKTRQKPLAEEKEEVKGWVIRR